MSDLRYELSTLVQLWSKTKQAEHVSPNTIRIYVRETAEPFVRFVTQEFPELTNISDIKGRHISAYILSVLEANSSAYAHQKYRALKTFFRWLVNEGEISESPMAKVKPPRVADRPIPVIPQDWISRLFADAKTSGRAFASVRDAAMMAVLLDCGPRVSELCSMDLQDVDRRRSEVVFYGKGRKVRVQKISPEAMRYIHRYLRARDQYLLSRTPTEAFWISQRTGGRVTVSTVVLMLRRRCARAGLPAIHPHQWRHTFGHVYQLNGGSLADLMYEMGHSDISTTRRYARSAAQERARASHDRYSPMGDSLS